MSKPDYNDACKQLELEVDTSQVPVNIQTDIMVSQAISLKRIADSLEEIISLAKADGMVQKANDFDVKIG